MRVAQGQHFVWKEGNKMAKDRITPCLHYICAGICKKGRAAEHNGYCQRCDKYVPRVRERHQNRKKQKMEELRRKETD